uniref:DJ-1/PfpI domain-containing protein n=1 Tax=Octactis speculum TaxID=3111310 RepID=A0A7S2DKH8_9STRA|mmetsp:Transcript_49546/g.67465  ORF Transcript_49546/g.67465 Transcript_49546/m.67465 type:complete len:199 (+) Transcript_49546:67-663(+)
MAKLFTPALRGTRVVIFVDFMFEDMEVMYPKIRLEEEGATVHIISSKPKGTKITGKYGYPVVTDYCIKDSAYTPADLFDEGIDALILPGGFAPDYMRREKAMLDVITECFSRDVPVAAICHGPWMLCSARSTDGSPVVSGRRATAFTAIKDDIINAGGIFVDEEVVVDGNLITSRTPQDLTPFIHAIITGIRQRQGDA